MIYTRNYNIPGIFLTLHTNSFNMKNPLTVLLFLSISIPSFSQNVKIIDAAPNHATVYSDRAHLTHEAATDLQAGKSELKLSGLSPYIDPQSIMVSGKGGFTILSVSHNNNYIENLDDLPEVKNLKSEIEKLELKIEDENAVIKVLKEKEAIIAANRIVPGKDQAVSVEYLKSVIDMYTASMEQVTTGILKSTRLIKDYETRLSLLKKQLSEITGKGRIPSGEISVIVTSEKNVRASLLVNYVTSGAGWYPSYDIRAESITKPVNIIYKANIHQTTGVPWKNIKLSFSSATPVVSGTLPELNPWFVDFNYPAAPIMMKSMRGAVKSEAPAALAIAEEESAALSDALPVIAVKQDKQTSVTFDVTEPYTINPDGRLQTIEIQKTNSPAEYKYIAVPKLSPYAYLTANISGWEKESFQNGEATLYFENGFIGKSFLNVSQLSDTLPVSLGTDNGIIVKREKRKDFTSKRTIGSNKTETLSFLITVRNNKQQGITINLLDQIPVSSNSGINIELVDSSGGKYDSATGIIKWELKLEPGENKELVLTYSARYPKDKIVILE